MGDYAHAHYALAATEAREAGAQAYRDGKPFTACPYGDRLHDHRRRRWEDGYREAKAEGGATDGDA